MCGVVAHAGDGSFDSRVRGPCALLRARPERVLGSAVDVRAPVKARPLHGASQFKQLSGGTEWVVRTGGQQVLCVAVSPAVKLLKREARVDSGHGFEVGSGPGEFQDDASTSAIADCGDPIRVCPGLGEQLVQGCSSEREHPVCVAHHGHDPFQHRFGLPEECSASVVIQSERQITVRGKIVDATTLVVIQTNAVVSEEDHRPGAGAVGFGEIANHRLAVDVVGNFSLLSHLSDASGAANGIWFISLQANGNHPAR